MRQAWTASWGQSLDATGYIAELRLIRDGGACILSSRLADLSNFLHRTRLAVPCSLWLNMFTYFSGPHTSQTGECIFKTLDAPRDHSLGAHFCLSPFSNRRRYVQERAEMS